jgi:hypothetical protein
VQVNDEATFVLCLGGLGNHQIATKWMHLCLLPNTTKAFTFQLRRRQVLRVISQERHSQLNGLVVVFEAENALAITHRSVIQIRRKNKAHGTYATKPDKAVCRGLAAGAE